MRRYIYCGQLGSGASDDPFRPEVVDEIPAGTSWSANQQAIPGLPPTPQPQFVVDIDVTDDVFAGLAYDPTTNPNGFDWIEIADDGTVLIHGA